MENESHLNREKTYFKIRKCVLLWDGLKGKECMLMWDGGSNIKGQKTDEKQVHRQTLCHNPQHQGIQTFIGICLNRNL